MTEQWIRMADREPPYPGKWCVRWPDAHEGVEFWNGDIWTMRRNSSAPCWWAPISYPPAPPDDARPLIQRVAEALEIEFRATGESWEEIEEESMRWNRDALLWRILKKVGSQAHQLKVYIDTRWTRVEIWQMGEPAHTADAESLADALLQCVAQKVGLDDT